MSVTLRKKVISKGRYTHFLDIYPPILHPVTGRLTRRHMLGIYTFCDIQHEEQKQTTKSGNTVIKYVPITDSKGNHKRVKLSPIQKEHNKETLIKLEAITSKITLQVIDGDYSFLNKDGDTTNIVELFRDMVEKRDTIGRKNKAVWKGVLRLLVAYTKGNATISNVDKRFIKGFKDYVLVAKTRGKVNPKPLKQNTKATYFEAFMTFITELQNDGILKREITDGIKKIQYEDTEKQILSLSELKTLVNTPCSSDTIKRASLFMALSGLRYGDVEALTWSNVAHDPEDGYKLVYKQSKVKKQQYLPITEQARGFLGDSGNPTDLIFPELSYGNKQNEILYDWIASAGISKKITFHSFRHTYATLLTAAGADIYLTADILGHVNVKTTTGYAKIAGSMKRELVERIKIGE